MSMFDENELTAVTDSAPEKTYMPAGDDYLEDYLDEIEVPKQDQPEPEIPDDETYLGDEVPEGPSYSKYQYETSQATALFLVKTIDQLLSTGIAAYALEPDPKTFQANKDELNEISGHLSVYFAENSFNLPPWAMAAIPATFVVTKKFNMAGKLRKANLDKKKSEDELKEVRRELERVKLEKQVAEAKNQLNELKQDAAAN